MHDPIDIELFAYDDYFFDFHWDDDGDFVMTNTLSTAVLLSTLGERRAESYEVAEANRRRGWIGNTLNENNEQDGSGLWLFEDRRLNTQTTNGIRDENEKGLLWLVTVGLAQSIDVNVYPKQGKIQIEIKINVTDQEIYTEMISV